ncbi:MAG: ferredoxin [Candidatus Woesearchaeota archaeon]
MVKYKIVFDRDNCIGAYACMAIAPDTWQEGDDGKAILVKEFFDDEELKLQLESARACPVNVIKIYNEETGEEIPL